MSDNLYTLDTLDNKLKDNKFVQDVEKIVMKAMKRQAELTSTDLNNIASALTAISAIIYRSNLTELVTTFAAFRTVLEFMKSQIAQEELKKQQEQQKIQQDPWNQIFNTPTEQQTWQNILGSAKWFTGIEKTAAVSLDRLEWFQEAIRKIAPIIKKSKDEEAMMALSRMIEIIDKIGFIEHGLAQESFPDDYKYMRRQES